MMKRSVLSVALCIASLSGAIGQTGTPKTPMALDTEINTLWPDNTQGFIIPFNARQTLLDMVASTGNAPPTSGPTCSPSALTKYQTFVNTTNSPAATTFNIFDGTQCVEWATLNETTHQLGIALGLPFATADTYTAGAADSLYLGVRGSFSSPVGDDQATAIFQTVRNNTATNGSVPTLYASTVKIGSGSNIINQAGLFEAVETAGNGGVVGVQGLGACTTASLGNCEGMVGAATATVAYSTLVGVEGNSLNSSGTNQTTTFSSSNFAAGFMATCGGTNTCFTGFMTNPTNGTTNVNGYYVAAATVTNTAFRNDASLVNGLDLSRGAYSGFAITSPDFHVGGTGAVTLGANGGAGGSLTLDGATSGSFAITASAAGVPTMSTPWPVAAGGTGDTGTAWGTFTLTPTCGSATFTSSAGQFKTIGKTTFVSVDIVFNAIGSCTNNLTFSLPNTVATNGGITGQVLTTGKAFSCALIGTSATTGSCVHADATNWNVSEHLSGTGVYQSQ
jgi:hypothetical protein